MSMTKIEIESRIADCKADLVKLEEELKEINALENTFKGWEKLKRPEAEKEFYFLDELEQRNYTFHSNKTDDKLYEIANYFSTLEKVTEVAKFQSLWRRIKRFADEHNEEFDLDECKHAFYRNNHGEIIPFAIYSPQIYFGEIYFSSEELARKAIDTFRDELEEYFGVNGGVKNNVNDNS